MITLEQLKDTQLPAEWELEVTNLLTMKVNKDVDLSAFAEYWVMEISNKDSNVKITIMKPQPEWYEFWK
jgi:hypothetical protein